jgi:uncharacterized protein
MERAPFLQQFGPGLRILAFVAIAFVALLFTSLLGLLIGVVIFGGDVANSIPTVNDLGDPAAITKLKYFQTISQLGLFIFPVILYVLLATKNRASYLLLNKRVRFAPALVSVSILLVALPFILWLADLNANLRLPEFMSGVEQWMMKSESDANGLTDAFLSGGSIAGFIANILIIAVIPAIGEELVFRGVLLRLFREWTKNIHFAILLSAFIFSVVHFQFYGFLPRFLMGALFGYMVSWSGSIWTSVIAHFINNVTAVIVAFLCASGSMNADYNNFGRSDNAWVIICSAGSVALMVLFLWLKRQRETVS